jgi:hypothetical protein
MEKEASEAEQIWTFRFVVIVHRSPYFPFCKGGARGGNEDRGDGRKGTSRISPLTYPTEQVGRK